MINVFLGGYVVKFFFKYFWVFVFIDLCGFYFGLKKFFVVEVGS